MDFFAGFSRSRRVYLLPGSWRIFVIDMVPQKALSQSKAVASVGAAFAEPVVVDYTNNSGEGDWNS
jgi:hypothetical protein